MVSHNCSIVVRRRGRCFGILGIVVVPVVALWLVVHLRFLAWVSSSRW